MECILLFRWFLFNYYVFLILNMYLFDKKWNQQEVISFRQELL